MDSAEDSCKADATPARRFFDSYRSLRESRAPVAPQSFIRTRSPYRRRRASNAEFWEASTPSRIARSSSTSRPLSWKEKRFYLESKDFPTLWPTGPAPVRSECL